MLAKSLNSDPENGVDYDWKMPDINEPDLNEVATYEGEGLFIATHWEESGRHYVKSGVILKRDGTLDWQYPKGEMGKEIRFGKVDSEMKRRYLKVTELAVAKKKDEMRANFSGRTSNPSQSFGHEIRG